MTAEALWVVFVEYTPAGLRLHAAERLPYEDRDQLFSTAHGLLCHWLEQLPVTPTRLHVALSAELAALVHTFPLEGPASSEEVREAVEFELQHFVPDYTRQHYATFVLPLGSDGHTEALTITYNRSELEYLRAPYSREIPTTLLPDCFSIPALWRYNYPDYAERNVLLLHLQPPYIDAFFLSQGRLVLFETVPATDSTPDALVQQCLEILSAEQLHRLPPPEGIFLFGHAVHRALIELLCEHLPPQTKAAIPCTRLNAFRMSLPPAELRVRHYAIRTAHLFWGCIGACLPQESTILVL